MSLLTSTARKQSEQQMRRDKIADQIAKIRFCNTLPDIPFDFKYLQYPFPPDRFVSFTVTSLQREHMHSLQLEPNLGLHIDLVRRDLLQPDLEIKLDEVSKFLLDDEAKESDTNRSRKHNRTVSWLRKTEYVSGEFLIGAVGKNPSLESKLASGVKQRLLDEQKEKEKSESDRDAQERVIHQIQHTFECAQKPITEHYSKPNITPVEIMPILPDVDLFKFVCALVIFDSDPAHFEQRPGGKEVPEAEASAMSAAMIRGMTDEHNENFVAYFLPTSQALQKMARKRKAALGLPDLEGDEEAEADADHDAYSYSMAREYNWTIKSRPSEHGERSQDILMLMKPHVVTYALLETKVRLSKRRKQDVSLQAQRTRLIVRQHEPNPEEVSEREERRAYLMSEELPVEEYKPDTEGDEQNEGAGDDEMKPTEDAEELEAAGEELEGDDDLKPHEEPMEETGDADAAEDNADDDFKPNADENAGEEQASNDEEDTPQRTRGAHRTAVDDIFESDDEEEED